MEHSFSPNSSTDLRWDAHQSQIIGGDAEEDHTQIVGGYTVNYWGGCGCMDVGGYTVSAPPD